MDKQLNIITIIAFTCMILTIILDYFVDFDFKPSMLFVGVAFLAMFIDYFITSCKDKNPFVRHHYMIMSTISFLFVILTVVISIFQHNLHILKSLTVIIVFGITIGVYKMISFSSLIKYIAHYDALEEYADLMSEVKALGFKLKR